MNKVFNNIKLKFKSQKGQGTVEYALVTLAIVGVLSVVLFATDNPLVSAITDAYENTADAINAVGPATT